MSPPMWHIRWAQRLIRDGLIPKPQFMLMTDARACALLAAHIGVDLALVKKMMPESYKARLTPASLISVSSSVYGVDDDD